MCFYDINFFTCDCWKWSHFRQRCSKADRTGEPCGMRLTMNTYKLNKLCKACTRIAKNKYSGASGSYSFNTRAATIPNRTRGFLTIPSRDIPEIEFAKKAEADQAVNRQSRRLLMLSWRSGQDIWEEDSEEDSELSSVGEDVYPQEHWNPPAIARRPSDLSGRRTHDLSRADSGRIRTPVRSDPQESTTAAEFNDNGKVDEELGKPNENNATASVFRQMKGRAWKSSQNPLLVISSTISKDNTAGEEVRKAKLFCEFGRKIQSKKITFGCMPPQSLSRQDRLDFAPPVTFDAQQDRRNIPRTSSYWSVPEGTDFLALFRYFGTDWTKTHIMAKNYYQRHVESGEMEEWEDIAKEADEKKKRGESTAGVIYKLTPATHHTRKDTI